MAEKEKTKEELQKEEELQKHEEQEKNKKKEEGKDEKVDVSKSEEYQKLQSEYDELRKWKEEQEDQKKKKEEEQLKDEGKYQDIISNKDQEINELKSTLKQMEDSQRSNEVKIGEMEGAIGGIYQDQMKSLVSGLPEEKVKAVAEMMGDKGPLEGLKEISRIKAMTSIFGMKAGSGKGGAIEGGGKPDNKIDNREDYKKYASGFVGSGIPNE